MDMVLARTFSVKPENKIAMKCPSWPDSPLHQYFGAKRSKRKDLDFVFSSLGYMRLYEYCRPPENCDDSSESEFGSSFVHLEERLRSDGPFVPYRRSPPRRVGLGLSERAREKRLLKYYKYFQGFQRKLQVSRQFQQSPQKPQNKAKVKKIINCYKPKAQLLPETPTSTSLQRTELDLASAASLPVHVEQNSTSLKKKSQKTEAPVTVEKTGSKIKKNTTSVDSSINKRLTDMVAVMSSLDSVASRFLQRKDRCMCTAIAPTLATIEENIGDCDMSESEPNLIKDVQQTPAKPDSVNDKQSTSKPAQQPIPNDKNDKPPSLRGILKRPVQANGESVSKNQDPAGEASDTLKPIATDLNDSGIVKQPRRLRKSSGVKKMNRDPVTDGTVASSMVSAGQLEIKDANLKKAVPQRKRRGGSVLRRSKVASSGGNVGNVSVQQDNRGLDFNEANNENVSSNFTPERNTPERKQERLTKVGLPSQRSVSFKKKKSSSSRKLKEMSTTQSAIKFTGWDYGTSLDTHTLEQLPEEKDLSEQLLKRMKDSKWGVNPQTVDLEYTRPMHLQYDIIAEDPKAYLQKHDILGIFQHFTKELVNVKPEKPFDLLRELAHDLSIQRDQKNDILNDLKAKKRNFMPKTSSSSSKVQRTSITKPLQFPSQMQPIDGSD